MAVEAQGPRLDVPSSYSACVWAQASIDRRLCNLCHMWVHVAECSAGLCTFLLRQLLRMSMNGRSIEA